MTFRGRLLDRWRSAGGDKFFTFNHHVQLLLIVLRLDVDDVCIVCTHSRLKICVPERLVFLLKMIVEYLEFFDFILPFVPPKPQPRHFDPTHSPKVDQLQEHLQG